MLQIFSILGIVAGFFISSHYYKRVGLELSRNFDFLPENATVSFIILFLFTWFFCIIVGIGLVRIVRGMGFGFFDRLCGGMIGFGKAIILSIVFVFSLTLFLSNSSPILTESVIAPYIRNISNILIEITPLEVQKLFWKKQNEIKKALPIRQEDSK